MTFTRLHPPRLESFADRLEAFAAAHPEGVGGIDLVQLARDYRAEPSRHRDAVSTALMAAYKETASKEAFALLYELNHEDFLRLIYHHLKRSFYAVDPADVLQEVFFNVYRYPFKFKPDRTNAFRNWTHSIIRNTVLKHSRRAQRDRALPIGAGERETEEQIPLELADDRAANPLDTTAEREAAEELVGAWRIYLHFYLEAYRCLTPREKRVLYLVEVESLPYREAADRLGVRVENLKMMVFRARRKIFTIMKRKFQAGRDAADRLAMSAELGGREGAN
ncbi:MAG: RNA polymerase sigma factor [Planctomycetota bacterium]|nr:MAG: RNA polymerase sigma factor [Planctomycetota bacterium]